MQVGYDDSSMRPLNRVLVLDDESPTREMLSRWLNAAGYFCEQAANVDEALSVLGRQQIDLVISDVRMPGRTGLDFLAQLQHELTDLAVIMLTGCDDPYFASKAVERGACGYLLKPVEPTDLLFQVKRALERRRLIEVARNYTHKLEQRVNEQTQLVRLAYEEVIHRLVVASMVRDDETGAHIKRIGLFSAAVAEAAGWNADAVDNIRLAAPMHDIGKIGIPDAILLKPGKLTPEEFAVMKTHTAIGANILSNSHSTMMQLAEQIARSHHERWDGSGYPDATRGEAIPVAARIVAIVDVYDALTHDRVYRAALPEAEALAELERGRGGHFDPNLLDVFLRALPKIRELARLELDGPPCNRHEQMQMLLHAVQSTADLSTVIAANTPRGGKIDQVPQGQQTSSGITKSSSLASTLGTPGPLARLVVKSREKMLVG